MELSWKSFFWKLISSDWWNEIQKVDDDIYDHGKLQPHEVRLIMSDNMQGYHNKNLSGIARNENAFPQSVLCVSYRQT